MLRLRDGTSVVESVVQLQCTTSKKRLGLLYRSAYVLILFDTGLCSRTKQRWIWYVNTGPNNLGYIEEVADDLIHRRGPQTMICWRIRSL